MTIICIITGVLELLLLVTVTGVLVTFAALFRLLEITLMSINPVCLYLIQQSRELLTCSIILMMHQAHHVVRKMCPSLIHEPNQNLIAATIEPLPEDMDINLQTPYVLENPPNSDLNELQQNSGEENNDDEIPNEATEIQSNTANENE